MVERLVDVEEVISSILIPPTTKYMKILILTGPAGAGKNTIAEIFAKKRERCAVVDVDVVRHMFVQPHKAPWAGVEGRVQQILGVQNACALVKNFLQNNCDVLILDVLSQETLELYKKEFGAFDLRIVLLLPTFVEIQKRNKARPPRITQQEIEMLYKSQETLRGYDKKIDNTNLSAEEVAVELSNL